MVIHHDDMLNRTTSGSGKLCDYTLAELRELDAAYHFSADKGDSYPWRGKQVLIPTLEEVLQAFPTVDFNIEIKPDSHAVADELIRILQKFSTEDRPIESRVIVGSRHCHALRYFRTAAPHIATSAVRPIVNSHVLTGYHSASERACRLSCFLLLGYNRIGSTACCSVLCC